MDFSPLQVLVAILVFQCASFAVFLFTTSRGKKNSNMLLGGFLFILAFHMMLNLLASFFEYYWLQFSVLLGLAYGPFIWFYIAHLIYKDFEPRVRPLYHFTPLGLTLLLMLIFGERIDEMVIIVLTIIQLAVYVRISLQNISKYQQTIRYTRSNASDISVKWIYQFIIVVVVIAMLDLFGRVFLGTTTAQLENDALTELKDQGVSLFYDGDIMFAILIIALVLFINLLVFKGLNRPDQFLGITSAEIDISLQAKDKYKNSIVQKDELPGLAETIRQRLKEERHYLDSNLNLESFAHKLELPPRTVSQVINQSFRTNFSDYINYFRLKCAEELLVNYTNAEKNISEIVYESGFNSRSSFYSNFKQFYKMSPKEYRSLYGKSSSIGA